MRRSTNQAGWNDLVRAAVLCAAFATAVGAVAVRAGEETASNIDLMQKLTAQVITELYGKFGPQLAGRAVQLKPAGTSEDYLFVTNVFREELTRLGVKVMEPTVTLAAPSPPVSTPANPANTASPGTQPGTSSTTWTGSSGQTSLDTTSGAAPAGAFVLLYQNVVFDLKYVDSHRSFVVGGKRVERRASVRIMTTLTDPADKHVVWVGEGARDQSDEVDYGDRAQLEQGNYAFNRPVVPAAGWGKYVEPVFVTGIIVGLIYLFFSNQSSN